MYYCECCNYQAKQKGHYLKHMVSKKHIELAKISQKLAVDKMGVSKMYQSCDELIICQYCEKTFKHKSSLSKHVKYSCKKNNDEDLRELVRLLNEQNRLLNEDNQKKHDHIEELIQNNTKFMKQTEMLQKQIDRLTRKLQVQAIGTQNNLNNSNGIINYNVKLLNFRETDYSHLTNIDYAKCVSDCNHCVKTLIEKVHFNKKKPENMNVYIASMKDKYIMVYKDNEWTLQNRKTIIDRMYDDNECEIDSWYNEHKEEFPEVVAKYKRYQKNKEEQDIVEQVKELIMLDCYNNRNMVKENQILDGDEKDKDLDQASLESGETTTPAIESS